MRGKFAALIFGTLPAVHMARGIVADALKF